MLVLTFLLATAAPQDPAAAPAVNPADRVTCITRAKTGSRVNFETICHTKAEWDLLRSENRRAVERGQQQQNRMDRDPPGAP